MTRRFSRLFAWSAAWLVAALVVFLVAAGGLPDTVAIHWGLDGLADGSAPAWMIPVVALVTSLVGLALAPIFSVAGEPSMESFAIVGMSGGLSLAVVAVAVSANYGISDWTEAGAIGLVAISAFFVVPALGILSGILIGRHWYPLKVIPAATDGQEVIEVEEGERVNWVGRARVRGVPLILFPLAIVLVFAVPGFPLWAFALVVGLGLVFSQVEAQVTNDGVRVRLGGIPVRKVAIGSISSARSIDAVPTELGGWGWRVVPGKTAIVLRAGDALALTFHSGRQFVITVDDAATGAALVNGLIRLSRPAT